MNISEFITLLKRESNKCRNEEEFRQMLRATLLFEESSLGPVSSISHIYKNLHFENLIKLLHREAYKSRKIKKRKDIQGLAVFQSSS